MLVTVFEKPQGLAAQHENEDDRIGCVPPVKSEHFLKHKPPFDSSSSGHGFPSPILSWGANALSAGFGVFAVLADPSAGTVVADPSAVGSEGAAPFGGVVNILDMLISFL